MRISHQFIHVKLGHRGSGCVYLPFGPVAVLQKSVTGKLERKRFDDGELSLKQMKYAEEFLPDKYTPSSIISLVFHPLLTPTPSGILILWLSGSTVLEAVTWIGICAAICVVPISIYIFVMKVYWEQDTSIRKNRHQLYIIGTMLTFALVLILEYLAAPRILVAGMYSGILSGIIGFASNLLDKVSLHVGVSTGISYMLFTIDQPIGLLGGVLTVLIAFARFQMKHHTLRQLAVAAIIPLGSLSIVFVIMGIQII